MRFTELLCLILLVVVTSAAKLPNIVLIVADDQGKLF